MTTSSIDQADYLTGCAYVGADWVRSNWERYDRKGRKVSELGIRAADLLGAVFEGIYHLGNGTLMKADWSHPEFVDVSIRSRISTYDDSYLTRLVIAAHDRCLRVEIRSSNAWTLRCTISKRDRSNDWYHGHPTLEDNVARQRKAMQ